MDDRESRLATARRILSQRLESLHRTGVEQIGKSRALPPLPLGEGDDGHRPGTTPEARSALVGSPGEGLSSETRPSAPPASFAPSPPRPLSPSLLSTATNSYPTGLPDSVADRQALLSALSTDVRACKLCRELACSRKQTVFGVGHARPRVVFFGEAPGADEDRQGEPFVGRAGQLLTKIIEACGWQRSDVYIMNVLKCRPPDNRNPLPAEVDNCRPFFERQFEILRPEFIVCVGAVPAQALLETTEAVGKLRSRFHRYKSSKVLVTYHPSYLLRNPSAKKYVWDDMQLLLKEMGLPIPKRGA
jgi:uracil-DNA glycosylase